MANPSSLVAIIVFATVVLFVGKSDVAAVNNCRCIIKNTKLYFNIICLRRLDCTDKLPLLRDGMIGKTLLGFGNRLYHAYKAVGNQTCIVRGSSYKLGYCIKSVRCFRQVWFIQNGPVSNFYYAMNYSLYRSYKPVC